MELLATKWCNGKELDELAEREGFSYKKGVFSRREEEQIRSAIEAYRAERGLPEDQILKLIFAKQSKDTDFWRQVALSVPMRPVKSVWTHVRRLWDPMAKKGKWTKSEDTRLEAAVKKLGQAWEKVSKRVGRSPADCRDRHRNHLKNLSVRRGGLWTQEEEDDLERIVWGVLADPGVNPSSIPWCKVAEMMGHRRNRQQCRNKWVILMHARKPEWTKTDTYVLVSKIASLCVDDESDIDWNSFPDPGWNVWTGPELRKKWASLKATTPRHETLGLTALLAAVRKHHAT
ncbi:hypothetical protein BC834DRAFT_906793 [Gloeopeniophorella convolvens]|nr:hypothetical protein BC834DRAFT_906793 [Gloeopeniophorella convolvens]